ncbi:MAG: gliding motility-associated protein GldE [Bacteroidales bacterium]|nr:gliding motility-associated protein GldE [Bacteroidales bacterium]
MILTTGVKILPPDISVIIGIIILIFLLVLSALTSGSELAFFSLSPEDIKSIKKEKSKRASTVLSLYGEPEKLLSTILVVNNLINVAITILSAFLSRRIFEFSGSQLTRFLIEVVVITFIIILFGDIIPKVYATRNHLAVVYSMASPLHTLEKIFKPVTSVLMLSTRIVKNKKLQNKQNISIGDLSDALELTSGELEEEEKILKGIVKFGNIPANAIMCPRVDVTAIDIKSGFNKVIDVIVKSGFSRIPVYSGSFDNVVGILYAKDILPYIGNPDSFKWQHLIRPPYFVPETKKINELLKEFQVRKIHMAIVIDEYGGTSGIVTLEDILEEIVGDIIDESDEEVSLYEKVDNNTYIFDGKILLNDFYKILNIEGDPFKDIRGDSETLAGLLLELTGKMPEEIKTAEYNAFKFIVESADKRRIKKIRVIVNKKDEESHKL